MSDNCSKFVIYPYILVICSVQRRARLIFVSMNYQPIDRSQAGTELLVRDFICWLSELNQGGRLFITRATEVILSHKSVRDIKTEIVLKQNKMFQER